MPTEDQISLVHAYLDGELDPANALAVKAQIDADPRLAAELAQASALREVLLARFPREPVSENLRRRVSAIGATSRWSRPSWTALAASVVLAIGLSSSATWFIAQRPASDYVAAEVLDGHLRSLITARPTDVSSSERHVVKPWFNDRIPQAPRVVDLSADGFPLLGARIDVIAKTAVPTLVYTRRRHVISLVALPSSIEQPDFSSTRSETGHNTIRWSIGGTSYFATSDLNVEELGTFARLFRTAPGG